MNNLIKKYFIFVFIIIVAIVFGIKNTVPVVSGYFDAHKNIKSRQEKINSLNKKIEEAKLAKLAEERKKDEPKIVKMIYEVDYKSGGSSASFNGMLDTILELAKQAGLKVKTIEFDVAPESDPIIQNHGAEYESKLLVAQFIGSYSQLQTFMRDIYKHQYLIGIQDFKIVPYEFNKKVLIIDMKLTLYLKK